ncbi:hypothetical protein [Niabella drilacis]|uniref:Uncharacterized protein n=1 Tax=Niabella drilacis (strain DSM 25811 / CCM 8410 / CCUG 62505 / LMG 26954 / E90) TaxID=1285928 RepID=A0A1G6NJ55_NIADE|nr:hypothetical protein [Niabella drilacis]SDC67972.1 hypothetical protein SAMN04487894_103297 [Niabella drilacis]
MKTTCKLIVWALLLVSCKNKLSEEQKVFLDFAALEDRYSGTQLYNNLYLCDYTIPRTAFDDKTFSVKECVEKLRQQIKFINDPEEGVLFPGWTETGMQEILPYPSVFYLNRLGDTAVEVSGKIWIPESVHAFSFDSTETGKTIHKDSMKITLLHMSNNVATLLVVDETQVRDYNYTYDMIDQSARKPEEKKADSLNPGYNYLFPGSGYKVWLQGYLNRWQSGSTVHFDNSRLEVKGTNKNGEPLLMTSKEEDFRHYLWYRNHDMPYSEMVSDYFLVRSAYRERDKNPDHFFSPIYIMTIAVAGKLQKVSGLIRSSKGKTEAMVLGRFPVLPAGAGNDFKLLQAPPGKIPEVNTQNVLDHIRAGSFEVRNRDRSENVCIYVSVRVTQNLLEQNSFSPFRKAIFYPYIRGVLGVTAKGDTIEIKDTENIRELLAPELSSWYNENIAAVTIPKPGVEIKTYICVADFSLLPAETVTYSAAAIPAGFSISNDRKLLTVPNNDNYPFKINLYNGNKQVQDVYIKEASDSSGNALVYKTETPVDKIELIRFNGERKNLPVNISVTPSKQNTRQGF